MLKGIPKVGQSVRALLTDYGVTTDYVYEIKGYHENSGNPYFIDDDNYRTHIDEEAFEFFELVEEVEKPSVNIGITGIEIDAENYTEFPTRIKLHLVANSNPNYLIKALDELHDDIAKLLRNKYQR